MKTYDAIIIGGGGGAKLRPVSEMGKKVAMIEKEALGGTCLNRGCIPSKMLIHPADMLMELREFEKQNLLLDGSAKPDFEAMVTRVTSSVAEVSQGIAESYKKKENVDFYHGHARFLENKVVEVNGEKLTAEKIFIATGARPRIPKIEGLEGTPFFTSTEALRNTKLPNKMIVIGGGFIAVELGYFYHAMGTEVHFLVRSKFIKQQDEDVIEEFTKAFTDECNVHMGVSPEKVEYYDGNFTVTLDDGEILEADALFVAAGVVPNSDELGLEKTDISVDKYGYLEVDDHLQTKVEGVYALGDVIGRYFFRHSVNFEGEYLLRTLYAHPSDEAIDYPPVPSAVFSNPQIGSVGKTEKQLKDEGVEYIVGKNPYSASAFGGDVLMSEIGFVKLLFEKESLKLVGAHIIGKEASSIIHMPIAYMNMGATLDDMLRTIYIHPAFPELVRNAARKAKEKLV